MKSSLFIIGFLMVISLKALSQENYVSQSHLKFNLVPSTMIDPTPRLRFGLEYKAENNFGYSLDYGIGNYLLSNRWGDGYLFKEIRPEVKYVFHRQEYQYLYGAMELFYMKMRSDRESGFYQRQDYIVNFDQATFTKQKIGVHLKGGLNLFAAERFDFDVYIGIGIAEREIVYSDVVNPVIEPGSIFVEWTPQHHLFEGSKVIAHFSLGFKIGYVLWRR
jgi:hypothetical protein